MHDPAAVIEAVRALSQTYTRQRDQLSRDALGERAELARLVFFLPRDLCKVFGPLEELLRDGPTDSWARPLRVLDVGAGLGTTSLGIARFLALRGIATARIELHAVERDTRALALFGAIADALPTLGAEFVPLQLHPHARDAEGALPPGEFDLISCGLVLNELEDHGSARAALIGRLADKLRPGGALIVLEPGSKDAARALMATRDSLLASGSALSIVAPCNHRAPCPMLPSERDWCHEELPFVLPKELVTVAKGAGLRYEGLSYAALVLRRRDPSRVAAGVRYRVVSDSLPSKGKLELYGCTERGYVRLSRLTRDESRENAGFDAARRGDTLVLEDGTTRVTRDTRVSLGVGPRAATQS